MNIDNIVIWTPTQLEYKRVVDYLISIGYRVEPSQYESTLKGWEIQKGETCISPSYYKRIRTEQATYVEPTSTVVPHIFIGPRDRWINDYDSVIVDLGTYQRHFINIQKEKKEEIPIERRVRIKHENVDV
jgi:hypothetical protein